MKKQKIILLIVILLLHFVLISVIINQNKNIGKETKIIKEMSESVQVTELNNQINVLNTEHTEYMNYIQTCKTAIATALTNEGIETLENDTFEKMVEGIGDIFIQRTKLNENVAATADNISEGKQAYVNGSLITGTLSKTLFDITSSSNKTVLNTSFYPSSTGTMSRKFNATKGKIYLFVGVNRAGTWNFNFSSNFHVSSALYNSGLANTHYVAVGYVDSDSIVTASTTANNTSSTIWFWVSEITFE